MELRSIHGEVSRKIIFLQHALVSRILLVLVPQQLVIAFAEVEYVTNAMEPAFTKSESFATFVAHQRPEGV
jgi:hypothetical protein